MVALELFCTASHGEIQLAQGRCLALTDGLNPCRWLPGASMGAEVMSSTCWQKNSVAEVFCCSFCGQHSIALLMEHVSLFHVVF